MKKLLSAILAGLLLLCCAACSKKDPDISGYYALTEIAQGCLLANIIPLKNNA